MARPLPADEPGQDERDRVRRLVADSEGDPLAPFALRPDKSFAYAPDGSAAVGYKVKLGVAVASGDPIGDAAGWPDAIAEFVAEAHRNGQRIAVLGAGERSRPLWAAHGLSKLAVGRDVVVRSASFTLQGRRFRNLRQGIQRTRNAGVTVHLCAEGQLRAEQELELRGLMKRSQREDNRGFSMILGRMFDGTADDAVVALARDRDGALVGAHRYLRAGSSELSLDFPMRVKGAPNGIDERIVAEVISWGAQHGIDRVSLAFAPFPELFASRHHLGLGGRVGYRLVHLLDPLISVERLYRYLRKFHAFDQERYVLLRWRQVVRVALAMLLLEFGG